MSLSPPTNCWTSAEKAIADMVTAAPAFVQMLERRRLTASDAASRVYGAQVGLPFSGEAYEFNELQELGTFAQVFPGESPYGKRRQGGSFRPFGETILTLNLLLNEQEAFDENRRETSGPTEFEWWFEQRVGELIDEAIAAFEAGTLHLNQIEVSQPPGYASETKQKADGKWYGCELTITWGMGS